MRIDIWLIFNQSNQLTNKFYNQFKPSLTKIFQIYFQKILVRKLLGWILVKITKNYKILVLLGLNTVYFFVKALAQGFAGVSGGGTIWPI